MAKLQKHVWIKPKSKGFIMGDLKISVGKVAQQNFSCYFSSLGCWQIKLLSLLSVLFSLWGIISIVWAKFTSLTYLWSKNRSIVKYTFWWFFKFFWEPLSPLHKVLEKRHFFPNYFQKTSLCFTDNCLFSLILAFCVCARASLIQPRDSFPSLGYQIQPEWKYCLTMGLT